MIIRISLFITYLSHYHVHCNSDELTIVDGDHHASMTRRSGDTGDGGGGGGRGGGSFIQKRREAAILYNRRHSMARGSHDIIFAPIEGKSIITKEKMYINAQAQHDDQVYEQMLLSGKDLNDIDSFFVTPPPQRTTVATRVYDDSQVISSVDMNEISVIVSGGSDSIELNNNRAPFATQAPPPSKNRAATTSPLRLVTLPRLSTTPPPPFKHVVSTPQFAPAPQMDTGIQFGNPLGGDPSRTSLVRFPAQPWQIPPRYPSRRANNWLEDLFEPRKLLQGVPPSPFNTQAVNQSNPFIPIGVSQPAPFPAAPNQRLVPPGWDSQLVHTSPLRNVVGYNINRQVPAIPLPSAGYPDQPSYTPQWLPQGVFEQPPPGPQWTPKGPNPSNYHEPKKEAAPVDFSIDEPGIEGGKAAAKTFVSDNKGFSSPPVGSEQLRKFAVDHPSILKTAKKPFVVREMGRGGAERGEGYRGRDQGSSSTPSYPQTTVAPARRTEPPNLPPPIVPGPSGLDPNQKLDLCCRKQMVSAVCQNMCNFETFNDKTLVSAFLTNQCPGPQLGKAYDCASSKADHSSCCERAGLAVFQGGKCMPFCRTHQNTPANVFDYLPCLQVFETIKGCYRQYQLSNKNIFGD